MRKVYLILGRGRKERKEGRVEEGEKGTLIKEEISSLKEEEGKKEKKEKGDPEARTSLATFEARASSSGPRSSTLK